MIITTKKIKNKKRYSNDISIKFAAYKLKGDIFLFHS